MTVHATILPGQDWGRMWLGGDWVAGEAGRRPEDGRVEQRAQRECDAVPDERLRQRAGNAHRVPRVASGARLGNGSTS